MSSCSPSGTRPSTTCSRPTATSSTARSSSTSPIRSTPRPTRRSRSTSAPRAQQIAAKVPAAKVVKAFNTTFAATLIEGAVAGEPLDVFLAGDDDTAKDTVKHLATDGGLRPIDAGPLALAHHIEAIGYLNMAIQPDLGT